LKELEEILRSNRAEVVGLPQSTTDSRRELVEEAHSFAAFMKGSVVHVG
jgi:ribosome recycling factor